MVVNNFAQNKSIVFFLFLPAQKSKSRPNTSFATLLRRKSKKTKPFALKSQFIQIKIQIIKNSLKINYTTANCRGSRLKPRQGILLFKGWQNRFYQKCRSFNTCFMSRSVWCFNFTPWGGNVIIVEEKVCFLLVLSQFKTEYQKSDPC